MPICFCAIGCQHSTFNRLFGCVFLVWRHHLRKVNKSSLRTFRRFFCNFLIFDVPQYSNSLDYIKPCDQRFTLATKKSLHSTFNSISSAPTWNVFHLDERLEGGEFLLPLVEFNVLGVVVESKPSHASRADRTVVLLVGALILARSTHTRPVVDTTDYK